MVDDGKHGGSALCWQMVDYSQIVLPGGVSLSLTGNAAIFRVRQMMKHQMASSWEIDLGIPHNWWGQGFPADFPINPVIFTVKCWDIHILSLSNFPLYWTYFRHIWGSQLHKIDTIVSLCLWWFLPYKNHQSVQRIVCILNMTHIDTNAMLLLALLSILVGGNPYEED